MTTTEQKYNRWKLRKEAFKKLKETKQYEGYVYHKILVLDNKNIEEIPDWIGGLKELKVLNLHNNNIEEIPSWIGKLKELQELDVNRNKIQKLPIETLKKCDSLEEIWLLRNPVPKKELERTKKELNIEILH